MDYVEQSLRSDEKVVTKAKISWLWLIPAIIPAAIFIGIGVYLTGLIEKVEPGASVADAMTGGAVGLKEMVNKASFIPYFFFAGAALVILVRVLRICTTHLAITNKRVIGKVGILKINTLDVPIEKVGSVAFDAGVLGNLFKYYKLSIKSTGSDGWFFNGVSNAQEFKDKLMDAIDKRADDLRKAQAAELAAAMNAKKD